MAIISYEEEKRTNSGKRTSRSLEMIRKPVESVLIKADHELCCYLISYDFSSIHTISFPHAVTCNECR